MLISFYKGNYLKMSMNYKELQTPPKCHYLVVWTKYGRREHVGIIGCWDKKSKTDEVLTLMTKDQFYIFESKFQDGCDSITAALHKINDCWNYIRENRNTWDEPLSCDYNSFDDYMEAWRKYEDEEEKVYRKVFPEDEFVKLFKSRR